MAPFEQQEAMNRFGAIHPYSVPGRKPSTLIWAKTPSSKHWPTYPFRKENPKVALPSHAERNGRNGFEYQYLWVGLLPADADNYNSSMACREITKRKTTEEKDRKKAWSDDVWKRMTLKERKEWSKEDKENARMDGAIDTRCVLDEDKHALRVVARVPKAGQDDLFAGGIQFHVLGRDHSEIEVRWRLYHQMTLAETDDYQLGAFMRRACYQQRGRLLL